MGASDTFALTAWRCRDTTPSPQGAAEAQKLKGKSWTQCLGDRSEQANAERSTSVCPPSPLPDIDSADKGNPLAASEYANDIIKYFKRVEPLYRVEPDYMSRQVCGFAI